MGLGGLIYLGSAAALFGLTFVEWIGVEGRAPEDLLIVFNAFGGGNAWQTMTVTPVLLVGSIAVALSGALLRVSRPGWRLGVPIGAVVLADGVFAALLIAIQIDSPPGSRQLGRGFSVVATLKPGVFLALGAALGIAVGGYWSMREGKAPAPAPRFSRASTT